MIILIVIGGYWALNIIQNKLMSDKINNYLLSSKSFDLNDEFKEAQMICVFGPYFNKTEQIKEIHQFLSHKQIIGLNKKINSLMAEDRHWDLVILKNDDYKVYQIKSKSMPNFKKYQCVFSKHDKMGLYPVYHSGRQMFFELR